MTATQKQSVGKIETRFKLIIKKTYAHPIKKVWEALSVAEQVSAWMEYQATIDPVRGGKFYVDFKSEGNLDGIITTFEPEEVLQYSWGEDMISWKVRALDRESTELTFTHLGLDKNQVLGLGPGWEAFIDALGSYLDGKELPTDQYQFHTKHYEELIGAWAQHGGSSQAPA